MCSNVSLKLIQSIVNAHSDKCRKNTENEKEAKLSWWQQHQWNGSQTIL